MKDFLKDILYCLKISLYFFIPCFLLGITIGFIVSRSDIPQVILWGSRIAIYFSLIGLAISAFSFVSQKLLIPLNYQKEWRTYFKKLDIAFAIFFVCLFILMISVIIYDIILLNFS